MPLNKSITKLNHYLKPCVTLLICLGFTLTSGSVLAETHENSIDLCWKSFEQTRSRVADASSQSVIVQTDSKGLIPYVALHNSNERGENYNLWQTLNGDIRGYALKEDFGFDYATSLSQVTSLTWHPTLIWNSLFSSKKPLKNYSCVLTGRTRVMGKRVSLIRLIPQEGLRYSYIIAKEDESDFPVELTISDAKGNAAMRLTVMESRIIMGMDFPIKDEVFEQIKQGQSIDSTLLNNAVSELNLGSSNLTSNSLSKTIADHNNNDTQSSLWQSNESSQKQEQGDRDSLLSQKLADMTKPTPAATMTGGLPQKHLIESNPSKLKPWPDLHIPNVFKIIGQDDFPEGGDNCIYQEYSDGLTSFRVYRNDPSTIHFPLLNNATLTIFRKNSSNHEYTVVGELPVSLAEHILSKIITK